MAEIQESGEQILSNTISGANQIIEMVNYGRLQPGWFGLHSCEPESLKSKVEWLLSIKKEVFKLDNGGYLTDTLLHFLVRRPPSILKEGVTVWRKQEGVPRMVINRRDRSELERSEYQVTRMIGLLGLILIHDGHMPRPPDPCCVDLELLLRFVGLRGLDGPMVASLLKLLREGSVHDQLIGAMALGIVAQQSSKVGDLVAKEMTVKFVKILEEGPMLLQAEFAYVMYKFIKIDPTICEKLPLDHVVGSLKLLQVATIEDLFWDHTEHFHFLREEDSSSVSRRMRIMAHKILLVLVKGKSNLASHIMEWLDVFNFSLHFLGIEERMLPIGDQVRESLLLTMLKEGNVHDIFISFTAIGGMAQQATILDKLPLESIIASLVSHLQVEVNEEQFRDHVNKATSVLSIVSARHNSNRRKDVDDENRESNSKKPGEQIQLSPGFKARMRVLAAKVLEVLARDKPSVCRIIVEKGALLCFASLLQNARLDVRLSSASALMEITAVAEKDTDLRRSAFRHNSYALKSVADQLIRIVGDASNGIDALQSVQQIYATPELLIPCIKAIGNLAATFRDTRPIIPLVHLLESANNEVSKESLAALTKFVCGDCFLHLDHAKAIISSGGLTSIICLAVDETIGLQKHALVLLCYVSLDALGNHSDKCKEILSAINLASRSAKFSKDEILESQLVQQAKRKLG